MHNTLCYPQCNRRSLHHSHQLFLKQARIPDQASFPLLESKLKYPGSQKIITKKTFQMGKWKTSYSCSSSNLPTFCKLPSHHSMHNVWPNRYIKDITCQNCNPFVLTFEVGNFHLHILQLACIFTSRF